MKVKVGAVNNKYLPTNIRQEREKGFIAPLSSRMYMYVNHEQKQKHTSMFYVANCQASLDNR